MPPAGPSDGLHHQNATGHDADQKIDQARQRLAGAEQAKSGQDHPGAARRDRQNQDERHERGQHRCRHQDHRGLGALDGRDCGGCVT